MFMKITNKCWTENYSDRGQGVCCPVYGMKYFLLDMTNSDRAVTVGSDKFRRSGHSRFGQILFVVTVSTLVTGDRVGLIQ